MSNPLDPDIVPLEEDEETLAPRRERRRGPVGVTETQKALGRALRARAGHEGLSVTVVAERATVDASTVSRLFNGQGGSWDTVERVAKVLRTSISAALEADCKAPGRGR